MLFVGRLEKRKGLKFLLRAWPMVLERQPNARLVVVGRGRPLEGYRRFAARQGWSASDVLFAGYVPAEDLPRYYQSSDVFCAPNTGQESFGIVLLEAMAAGAPIVASDIPGYRDVVSDGEQGLLVEPKNAGALADAIRSGVRQGAIPSRRVHPVPLDQVLADPQHHVVLGSIGRRRGRAERPRALVRV